MDYRGTTGADVLDQAGLGLPDWARIFGLAGDDTLSIDIALAIPGPGADRITGRSPYSTVAFWEETGPVTVDLGAGFAIDSGGARDTLVGINSIHTSGHADSVRGSDRGDSVLVLGSGTSIDLRGGHDTVSYMGQSGGYDLRLIGPGSIDVTDRGTGRVDRLRNVEQVRFADVTVTTGTATLLRRSEVYVDTDLGHPADFLIAAATDLDGDGRTDLVVATGVFPPTAAVASAPIVLRQTAGGWFASDESFVSGQRQPLVHPREIAFGELNGDGRPDVLIVGHGYDTSPFPGERSVLWLSTASGMVDASARLPDAAAFTHSVALGDADANGTTDIFLGNIYGREREPPRLLLGDGAGGFSAQGTLPASLDYTTPGGGVFTSSLLADLDGDGRNELIVGEDGRFRSAVYRMDGAGRFTEAGRTELPAGRFGGPGSITVDVVAGDVNGDGRPDLIMSQTRAWPDFYRGRAIQVLIQQRDGSFRDETGTRMPGLDTAPKWITFLDLADVNRDGFADIIATGSEATAASVFVNDGTGRFTAAGPESGFPALAADWLVRGVQGELYSLSLTGGGLVIERFDQTAALGPGPNGVSAASQGAAGFNEAFYRNQNADVRAAVAAGRFESGLAHYLAHGRAEGRASFAPGATVEGCGLGDRITLREGNETAWGYAGDDLIAGGAGHDRLVGGGGNDTLGGGPGNDTLEGGAGIDTASYAGAAPVIVRLGVSGPQDTGGAGIDVLDSIENLSGGNGADRLAGSTGANLLTGGHGNDTLVGWAGDDTLDGGPGDDLLDGGPGQDTARYAGPWAVTVSLAATGAQDTGEAGRDTLIGIEHLAGGNGADRLTGNAGANRLDGGVGNDTLGGGAGDDTLVGGAGQDVLWGGLGRDRFVFAALADSPAASPDRIADFLRGQDVIDLAALDAVRATPTDDAFRFLGQAAFTGVAGEVRVASGLLSADVDGDRVADFALVLTGVMWLDAGSLIL